MNADLLAMALRVLDTVHKLEAVAKYADQAGFADRLERIANLRAEVRSLSNLAHAT